MMGASREVHTNIDDYDKKIIMPAMSQAIEDKRRGQKWFPRNANDSKSMWFMHQVP